MSRQKDTCSGEGLGLSFHDDPQPLCLRVELPDSEGEVGGEGNPGQVGEEEESGCSLHVREYCYREQDEESLTNALY